MPAPIGDKVTQNWCVRPIVISDKENLLGKVMKHAFSWDLLTIANQIFRVCPVMENITQWQELF